MRRALRWTEALFAVIVLTALPSASQAQAGNEASIDGLATDATGSVLPDVVVFARRLETGVSFTVRTNDAGLFRFSALPTGTYAVRAESPGFAPLVFERVQIGIGARVTLPLHFAVIAQAADMTVRGEAPLLETSRTGMSGTIDHHSIATLPVNGRDFTSFALLLPGITTDVRGGLSVGGQRAMNSLLVDGVNANDSFWGQPIGTEGFVVVPGQTGYHVSLETVQEFQVSTNAYSAQFGRAGGGVVNTITRSGTSEFHGDAFEFYRDKSLNANTTIDNALELPKDPFHFNQFGGVLGGPLVPGRLFFFTGYDTVRSNIANGVLLNLPPGFEFSADSTTAGFERLALGYLHDRDASWSIPVRQDDWLTKLDWQQAPSRALALRWTRQRLDSAFSGFTEQSHENAVTVAQSVDVIALSVTSTLSPSLVNVARASYADTDSAFLGVGIRPQADVFEQGQRVLRVGRSPATTQDNMLRRLQLLDTLSWVLGHHALSSGVDVLLNGVTYYASQNFAGSYRYLSLASFGESLAGVPDPAQGEQFMESFSDLGAPGVTTHPDSNEIAAFVDDQWRIRRDLTLNLGLRYDLQVMSRPPVTNPSPQLAAAGLDTAERPLDPGNVAPRVGVAWSPGGNPRRVVRAGYGRFYAPTPSAMASRAHFLNGITLQPRTFRGGTPDGALIPAYPNTICGPPDPSGAPPSCRAPAAGAPKPILMFFSPSYREPFTHQAGASLECAVGADASVTVSYVFARGVHLQWVRDVNLAPPTSTAIIGIAGTTSRLEFQRYTRPRPLTEFDRVSLFDSGGSSVYHAMTVSARKRLSHDVQWQASYTLGKVIDDNPNVYALNPGAGDAQLLSDPLNPRRDRSRSVNDQRHRLVFSGSWQPTYPDGLPAPARALIGGWEVSGLFTVQSGRPYSALVDADLNNDGNFQTDRTPGVGRNSYTSPENVSLDLRLARTVRVGSHVRLQAIAEAFNLLNHPNVTGVNTTEYAVADSVADCGIAGTPCLVPQDAGPQAFRTPTATGGPRIIQLGLKLLF